MGFSAPSGSRCASTAPMPYAEASQANTRGNLESKWTSSGDDVSSRLDS